MSPTPAGPLCLRQQGYFYAGGRYADTADGTVRTDQMFVGYQIPWERPHAIPLVLIAGAGQSGLNYWGTPDGREGWAPFFLRRGWAVYVPDPVARGRSSQHADLQGTVKRLGAEAVENRLTRTSTHKDWPEAASHSQWPGSGVRGDETFDQFMAQQMPYLRDFDEQHRLNLVAMCEMLDRIGPSVLVVHSQAGPLAWLVADARPTLVRAIVAVEPTGPPFADIGLDPAKGFGEAAVSRPYGLSGLPLRYDPPLGDANDLVSQVIPAKRPDRSGYRLQAEPARRLPALSNIPVLLVSGAASFHINYDEGTVAYLRQAGVTAEHYDLGARGIKGNGHMMMLEQNSDDIAAIIEDWISNVLPDMTKTPASSTKCGSS